MESFGWPGNVRELRNVMERLIIMVPRRRIDVFDLPETIVRKAVLSGVRSTPGEREEPASLQEARERFEREFILQKLAEHKGNIPQAAQALKIERSNLYRKMRQLGIPYSRRENGDLE